jgi:hypothetical protein
MSLEAGDWRASNTGIGRCARAHAFDVPQTKNGNKVVV